MEELGLNQTVNVDDIAKILPSGNDKIPPIIHYCWFGGKPLPQELMECLKTWEKLKGYTVMRWDESNCSFSENEFIKQANKDKQFCFICDYYRLKALYEYGGIYFDTDVKVYRSFDPLLHHKVFLSFNYDCCVGTAIIAARKGDSLIKNLIDMYDNTIICSKEKNGKGFYFENGKLYTRGYFTNNYYFTYYILKHYPTFKLNNKFQDMGDFVIYPKEKFEIGSVFGKYYAIHINAGAWRKKYKGSGEETSKIKRILKKAPKLYDLIQIIVRKRRYKALNKKIPFYQYSLAQKKGTKLPEL